MNKRCFHTDYLFSTPDFWIAAGSVINLAGSYYSFNTSKTEVEADCNALGNDFRIIGQDLTTTIDSMLAQLESTQSKNQLIAEN